LPNTTPLYIYVFTSTPHRTKEIFPHTSHPPRCFQTDYLVVVGADVTAPVISSPQPNGKTPSDSAAPAAEGSASATITPGEVHAESSSTGAAGKMVLTSAISAHLYAFPSSSSSVLYISKVDSSALGPPLSSTRKVVSSFIAYHLDPSTRPTPTVRVQLFARSQGQYLFPNSAKAKKGLGGLRLCGWWKSVYEEAVREVLGKMVTVINSKAIGAGEDKNGGGSRSASEARTGNIELSYLLPSYSAGEAAGMLGLPRQSLPPGIAWSYAAPFETPIVCASAFALDTAPSLATLIPSLPDDPKTRFLAELVGRKPHRLPPDKAGTAGTSESKESDKSRAPPIPQKRTYITWRMEKDAAEDEAERKLAHAVLSRTSKEEFWERMGFRQECASGDVTGFFTAQVSPVPPFTSRSETHMVTASDPTGSKNSLPHTIVDRLLTALLNTDFADLELAIEGSAAWTSSAKEIVSDEIGKEGWGSCVGTVVAKEGVKAQARSTGADREKRKEEAVTMLQPKKKKKL
jgi:regulator of Ty1 transposition protein 109